jgi:hypothetical protein
MTTTKTDDVPREWVHLVNRITLLAVLDMLVRHEPYDDHTWVDQKHRAFEMVEVAVGEQPGDDAGGEEVGRWIAEATDALDEIIPGMFSLITDDALRSYAVPIAMTFQYDVEGDQS